MSDEEPERTFALRNADRALSNCDNDTDEHNDVFEKTITLKRIKLW